MAGPTTMARPPLVAMRLNPATVWQLRQLSPSGERRDGLNCPVAPDANPKSDTLFEDAQAGASKRYYLPHWQIGTRAVTDSQGTTATQYRVSLESARNGAKLTVYIEPQTAEEDSRLSASGLSVFPLLQPTIKLNYATAKSPSTVLSQSFEDLAVEGTNYKATANLTLGGLADVYNAMTTTDLKCELVVSFAVTVAIPLPPPPPPPANPPGATVQSAPAVNRSAMRPEVMMARPAMMAAVRPNVAMRPMVMERPDMVRVPAPPPPPAAPPPPLFRKTVLAFESSVTFNFNKDLYSYIYLVTLGSVSVGGPLFNVYNLQLNDTTSPYYQPRTQAAMFFYLPDGFKICRRAHPPYYPDMSLSTTGTTKENLIVTLTYRALPVIDMHRIADAKAQLAAKAGVTKDGQLMQTSDVTLRLALPGQPGTNGPYGDRSVKPDLARGFQDAITMPADQFTQLFDSFCGDSGIYFQGQVIVNVDKDMAMALPFSARANDLCVDRSGDLFVRQKSLDASSGGVTVTLVNATESTIHVPIEAVQLVKHDGTAVLARLVSASPRLPCDLPPAGPDGSGAGTLALTLAPLTGAADDSLDIAVDLAALVLVSEREALWNAIVDETTVANLDTTIELRAAPGPFQPTADGHYLSAIQIDFEVGKSVSLEWTAGTALVKATVQLPLSITDYILRKVMAPTYRYKRTLIYFDGKQLTDKEWITGSSAILTPETDPATFPPGPRT
jgi:hypothetical protein